VSLRVARPARGTEAQRSCEAFEDRRRRQDSGLGGSELERERDAFEPPADFGDGVAGLVRELERTSLDEEADGIWLLEGSDAQLALPSQPQHRAARHEDVEARRALQQLLDVGRRLKNVLEVVEHEEELDVAKGVDRRKKRRTRPVMNPDALTDRRGDEAGVGNRSQRNEHDAVDVAGACPPRGLDGKARLPDAARPRHRHEPVLRVTEEAFELVELLGSADEAVDRRRKVRARPSGGAGTEPLAEKQREVVLDLPPELGCIREGLVRDVSFFLEARDECGEARVAVRRRTLHVEEPREVR
jgi:hypothetical protein